MKNRYRTGGGATLIDLRIREVAQLFDSLDPSPFIERDLDDKAAAYIVTSALEHPIKAPLKLIIHLQDAIDPRLNESLIADSIHNYFNYHSELAAKKLRQLLKRGQMALVVGLVFLTSCLSISHTFFKQSPSPFAQGVAEGLLIIGWVAMWGPIEIFLYSWWPELEKKRIYEKLSSVPVEVLSTPVATRTPQV